MSKFAPKVLCGCRVAPALLAIALAGACANVQAAITCVFTTYSVAFGNYDPSAAGATNGSGTVSVNCTRDNVTGSPNFTVALAIGAGNWGSFANRQMQISTGSERLLYNLYRDPARTLIWGDGIAYPTASIPITGIAKNSSKTGSFTIYGRIPALQNVAAGNYADSVLISITP